MVGPYLYKYEDYDQNFFHKYIVIICDRVERSNENDGLYLLSSKLLEERQEKVKKSRKTWMLREKYLNILSESCVRLPCTRQAKNIQITERNACFLQ